ncbi:hypothetical protein L7F22_036639 [Adiantum nelumboides]|nr:hypothetical protein [Adiantum nelumboides]
MKNHFSAYLVFARDVSGSDESNVLDKERSMFSELFSDRFYDSLPSQLSPKRPEDHAVDLVPGSSPSNRPPYRVAKVYVSICGDERGKEMVMEGLKAKTKHVRAGLGKRMQLRLTPEVRFIMDDSLERGSRVLAILDRLRTEREERAGKGDMDDAEDDDNWEDIEEDQKLLATGSKEMDDDELEKGSG